MTQKTSPFAASTAPDTMDFGPEDAPSLTRAAKIAEAADQNHFFWSDPQEIMRKVFEEVQEVADATDPDHRAEEIGDALFTLACLSYAYRIDPERALQKANDKLISRWQCVVDLAHQDGKTMQDLTPAMLESYWQRAKVK